MGKKLVILTALFLLAVLAACSSSQPSGKQLVLLHTSDEHSYILGVGPEVESYPLQTTAGSGLLVGGIGQRLTILKQERAAAKASGASVITASSGDNMMGTLFQLATLTSAPDYESMGKALGYDVGCLGNHDIELGPEFLASALETAMGAGGMFWLLSSNIHFSNIPGGRDAKLQSMYDEGGADATKAMHKWKVITTSNGLKVGFFGIMGYNAARLAPGKAPVTFSVPDGGTENDESGVMAKIYVEAQAVVDYLRTTEKADVVVLLGHTGTDLANQAIGESYRIAQNVTGIDVILSGHTHLLVPPFHVANATSGKNVIVSEPQCYGAYVTRLVLNVADNGTVTFDDKKSAQIKIDDKILPDVEVTAAVNNAIRDLEVPPGVGEKSFLEGALSEIEGKDIVDDPATTGELYFYPFGNTTYSTMPVMNKETGAIRIAADALLAASVEVAGKTDLAITAGGIVRDGFYKGYTGKISFADLYRVYPLGESPIDGSPGFPMTRFGVRGVELKVVLEVTASFSYGSPDASNNYLIPAGVCFKYDTKRAAFDPKGDPLDPANGRVTWVAVATDHTNLNSCTEVIFTLKDGFLTPFKYYSLATDYYMALFATSFGLTLHSPDGSTDYTSPNEAIMYRPDKSEYKSYQALAKYVETICGANGGYLPDRYNDAASPGPYRAICLGPLCVK